MLRVLIANAFAIWIMAGPGMAQDMGGAGQIVVTGQAQVQASPDIATVTLGVAHEARDARAAMTQVTEDVRRLFERLSAQGVQPRDVQTTTLRLDPVWRERSNTQPREAPMIVGFVARNDLTIRLREMDQLGEVLELLLEDGANRFSGVTFGLRDPEPLLDTARREAVADARRKARIYAQAAGVQLGEVLRISEPGTSQPPGPVFARMEAADGMAIAPGELTFSAEVTLVYGIGPLR